MSSANTLSHSKFCTRPPPHSWPVAIIPACRCAHFQPGTTIVRVHGAVDAGNAERLSDYVDDLASPGRFLILDLRGVSFLQRRRAPGIGQDRREVPANKSAMGTGYQPSGRPAAAYHG